MFHATIASPFEIWSCGMEAILKSRGCDSVTRVTALNANASLPPPGKTDLLIVARGLVDMLCGKGTIRPLRERFGGDVILVLEPDDELTADEFVTFNVEGLLLSSASVEAAADCIHSVRGGRQWMDPHVRSLLGHSHSRPVNWEGLSSREDEVARLAASGFSNKRIARELQVSDGTVKMHMHHILGKLRMGNRSELASYFHEQHAEKPDRLRRNDL